MDTPEKLSPERADWVAELWPRVRVIARRHCRSNSDRDAVESSVQWGLIRAALEYDPDEPQDGLPFRDFAEKMMRKYAGGRADERDKLAKNRGVASGTFGDRYDLAVVDHSAGDEGGQWLRIRPGISDRDWLRAYADVIGASDWSIGRHLPRTATMPTSIPRDQWSLLRSVALFSMSIREAAEAAGLSVSHAAVLYGEAKARYRRFWEERDRP